MVTIGGKFSSRLWRLCRIGRLFQDAAITNSTTATTSIQVVNRSSSLHTQGTQCTCLCGYSSGMSLHVHSIESSIPLFLNRPVIASAISGSVNCKTTRDFCSNVTLSSRHLCSRVEHRTIGVLPAVHNRHDNIVNNSVNGKVAASYSNHLSKHNSSSHFQFYRGLKTVSVPANHDNSIIRNDDRTTSHEQTRSVPMDVEELVGFLRDENARDICVIRVPPQLDYVDYFVVCSGFGGRHLRRMADGLVAEVYTAC